MEKIITNSSKQTKDFAKKFVKNLNSQVIALTGELGSGKTIFVQGLAEGLEIKDRIISPTFVLVRQHKISNSKKILYHIDLYRLEDKFSIIGLDDLLSNPNAIVVIEWAEKIKNLLPKDTVWISLKAIDTNRRKIKVVLS